MGLREEIEAALADVAAEGGARVLSIDGDEPLDLPGFDLDRDERLTTRDVDRDEAVAATEVALRALGIGPEDPLFIHLGA
jgi:hypothetical protein